MLPQIADKEPIIDIMLEDKIISNDDSLHLDPYAWLQRKHNKCHWALRRRQMSSENCRNDHHYYSPPEEDQLVQRNLEMVEAVLGVLIQTSQSDHNATISKSQPAADGVKVWK